jgi:membrane protein implicated in regulation of membrane protease activity
MESSAWWVWLALAAILLIGEIFTAGFFLFWFSIGSVVAGIVAYFGVGLTSQVLIFAVVSTAGYLLGRRFAERVTKQQPPGIGADRVVGEEGVVIDPIDKYNNTGRIRIRQDEWRAISETSEVIPSGVKVKVIRIDGTRAVVIPIKKE